MGIKESLNASQLNSFVGFYWHRPPVRDSWCAAALAESRITEGIRRFHEEKRERFLSPNELQRVNEALAKELNEGWPSAPIAAI